MAVSGTVGDRGLVDRLRALVASAATEEIAVSIDWAMTRSDLLDAVLLAARRLHACGINEDSRVGISLSNERDHLVASLALFELGALQVALASFDTNEVQREIAQRVELDAVLAPQDVTLDLGRPHLSLAWPLAGPGSDYRRTGPEGSLVLRTSGTTGRPNLLEIGAEALVQQSGAQIRAGDRRNFRLASIEHNNGKRHRLYGIAQGETGVFGPLGHRKLPEFLLETAANHVQMSVMHATELARQPGPASLRHISFEVAGSTAPPSLRRDFVTNVSPHLVVRYGATECGTISVLPPGVDGPSDSVGWPADGVEVEIVDEDGVSQPAEVAGHVRVRAPRMISGYFDSPEQSAKRFRDGWFWPGDLGSMTKDGQLCLKGRADDMMILNSINIFPSEIEDVLLSFPGVREAAAAALRSSVHGDIPIAAVVSSEGQRLDVPELMRYARSRLSLRAPRRIVQVDQLPRSEHGKVLRRQIPTLFEVKNPS